MPWRCSRWIGLADKADAIAGALPYTDERRLGIARALVLSPAFVLLDEPAAGMSDAECDELMHSIAAIPKDFTCGVLLIEHNMRVVMGVCDRIHVLDGGRTIAEGTPPRSSSDAAVIIAYLGDGGVTAGDARESKTSTSAMAGLCALRGVSLSVRRRRDRLHHRPERRRQIDDARRDRRRRRAASRHDRAARANRSPAVRPEQIARLRLLAGARGAPCLRHAHGRGKPAHRHLHAAATARPWPTTIERVLELFPRLQERSAAPAAAFRAASSRCW